MQLDLAPPRPPPHARAGQAAGRRAARAVAPDRRGRHRQPRPRAAPGAVRAGHRRHHPRRSGLPGLDRQVLHDRVPELPAPERLLARAATSQTRRKEEVRDQLTDTLLGGLAPPQAADRSAAPLSRGDARHRVLHARLRQAGQGRRAGRGQAQGVLRAEQAPVHDAGAAQGQRAAADARRRQGAHARSATRRSRPPTSRTRRSSTSPRSGASQQLAFPDKAAAEKAYAELAKAKNFNEAVDQARLQGERHRSRPARAHGHDRRQDRRGRLRAEEGRAVASRSRASSRSCWCASARSCPASSAPSRRSRARSRTASPSERAGQEIQALHDKVENERAAGKPLKEIGEQSEAALPRDRRDRPRGQDRRRQAGDRACRGRPRSREAAFAGAAGIEAEAIELGDGGYAWVDVLGVTPEKQKPFEEVKAEVQDGATSRRSGARRSRRSPPSWSSASTGARRLEAHRQGDSAPRSRRPTPSRATPSPQGLTQNAVQQAFALPKGGATSAPRPTARRASSCASPTSSPRRAPTPEQTERLKAELTRQMQTDILAEYVAGLQARYGLTVNEAALKQALGREREQPDSSDELTAARRPSRTASHDQARRGRDATSRR